LADLELVQRLEQTRAESGTIWGPPYQSSSLAESADEQYALAFRQSGMDVDALGLNDAVERITARRAIAAALLPAMDDWVAVRSVLRDKVAAHRLLDLLKAADADPWRQQVRDAIGRGDRRTLATLAKSPDLERQPAATLAFLCAALRSHGMFPAELEVLRRTQWKYPADFWTNLRLGTSLTWFKGSQDVNEGIGYLRAAMAVRPRSDQAAAMVGNGYYFLREFDQSIAWYRKAIEIRGTSAESSGWYSNLGITLGQAGQHQAAISAFEQSIKLKAGSVEAYCEFAMVLSNSQEARLRDPDRAAEMAERALELNPKAGGCWSALGVARYRQNQWQEARIALKKSLELGGLPAPPALRDEADFVIVDWLFLAMSSWKVGEPDEARRCYQQAVAVMESRKPTSHELLGLRAEAEALLGLAAQPASRPATASGNPMTDP